MKRNILYVFQEITPYLPETPMSIIGRQLPPKVQEKGNQIRVFMPKYGTIKERRHQLHEVIRLSGMNIVVNDIDHSLLIKVASIQSARMQIYFIDNEEFFHRKAMFHSEEGIFFEDNDERALFFARGVMETIKKLRWTPEILHINGWIGSLIPLYIKKSYKEDPIFSNTKVVVSLYDDQFPELFNNDFKKKIKFDGFTDNDIKTVEKPDYINLMKLAIKYADGVIEARPNVNQELIDFAKQQNKKFLSYTEDTDINEDIYLDFYESVQKNQIPSQV